jgi:acetaldehyde dehydrogenase (acetylating)
MDALAMVYDIQGRKVKDIGKIWSDQYVTTVIKQVDLTSAANGNYLLVVNNLEDNKRLAKQFIKI